MDLNYYQNIISLSSGKSRKMRISGTKAYLNKHKHPNKSKYSSVDFL